MFVKDCKTFHPITKWTFENWVINFSLENFCKSDKSERAESRLLDPWLIFVLFSGVTMKLRRKVAICTTTTRSHYLSFLLSGAKTLQIATLFDLGRFGRYKNAFFLENSLRLFEHVNCVCEDGFSKFSSRHKRGKRFVVAEGEDTSIRCS